MSTTDIIAGTADYMMQTYKRWPIEIVSGRGSAVTDSDGHTYIDLVAGIAVASVGHAHPKVTEAIADQAARLVHVSNLYGTRPQLLLAERLACLCPGKLSFFVNSGAEAIECALKLARKWGGPDKSRIVAAAGGFHGRTFGALAATGQPAKQTPFAPMLPGFSHVPFGDPDALWAAMGADVAAVILEPIQGEAGVIVPPQGYLGAVREMCDGLGALLILDEIQTGLGRTGHWFAHQHNGVIPDVMCLAKALAAGLPMGVCLARSEVAAAFSFGDHGTTFGGGPIQSAAALAVLDIIESEGLVERARIAGLRVASQLQAELPVGAIVRGRGLMIGIEWPRPVAREFARLALERGVLVNDVTPSVIRLTPPLVISDDAIDAAVEILVGVGFEVAAA
ncbi:MAG: acetylornithine transaminase [Actinomycetota bacterium]|nr:acetylornithine transaminase [Actinomycetota bacterium]